MKISGSIEGESGNQDGRLLYRLGEKRCKNFDTCDSANTNTRVLAMIAEGRDMLAQGDCDAVKIIKDRIISLMTIPLVQGTLRYARKIGAGSVAPKEIAEGVAFAGSILPQLDACGNGTAAQVVIEHMWMDADKKNRTAINVWTDVKAAILGSVDCLGITLEDLGIKNIEAPINI